LCSALVVLRTRRSQFLSNEFSHGSRNTMGRHVATALLCGGFLSGLPAPRAEAQVLDWVRQFGAAAEADQTCISWAGRAALDGLPATCRALKTRLSAS
jgi:hypothetical protein